MRPTIGCLIRFKDSASTLPRVLERLSAQTLRPDVILGVDTGSRDGSDSLILEAVGRVISWQKPYSHPAVANFGIRHLTTDLVLILSSHTTLEDSDAIERMAEAFDDRRVACASAKWDNDPYYSDSVTWEELQTKGLKFGSIYSNSMGMLRRSCWAASQFDETLPTAEDYAWAIEQLKRGGTCRRLDFRFDYQRAGNVRDGEFASVVFSLARQHKLRVAWLGAARSLFQLAASVAKSSAGPSPHYSRLKAWLAHRLEMMKSQSSRNTYMQAG